MVVAVLASSAAGRADSTPTVRAVPSVPVLDARLAASKTPIRIVLDAAPPASTSFYLEIPMPGDGGATGVLEVWPVAEQQDERTCAAVAPVGARQHYSLGLTATTSGDQHVLRATVPPLQVAQRFCFAARIQLTLSADEMSDIADDAGSIAFGDLLASGASCDAIDFDAALTKALSKAGITVTSAQLAAQRAAASFRTTLMDKCSAFLLARDNHDAAKRTTTNAQTRMTAADDAAKKLPRLPPLPSPRLTIDGKPVDVLAIAAAATPAPTVQEAALQLRARASDGTYSRAEEATLDAWAAALDELARAIETTDATQRATKVGQAIAKIKAMSGTHRLQSAEIAFGGGKYKPDHALAVLAPEAVPAADVLADLDWIGGHLKPPNAAVVAQWKAAFTEIGGARKELADALQKQAAAKTIADSADSTLRTALPAVFDSDAVRRALVLDAQSLRVQTTPGEGTTPAAANYASVDAGAVVAFPSGGASAEAWVVPYLGLNLYSAPVDRTIALSELTGGGWMKLRQRVSLTIGMTLTEPTLQGRTINPAFAGHYPITALGIRMTQFTRLTGGAIFYEITDANPVSARRSLVAAPFVGAALDIDVIHLLTTANL